MSPSAPSQSHQISAPPITPKIDHLLRAAAASNLNSLVYVDTEGALASSRLCDSVSAAGGSLGTLHGMPVAIKDLIDVAGLPTTMGSEQYLGRIATADSTVVNRLRAAGAIIIGKANTHEFAYGSSGDRSYFGPVRNPHNPEHMSGGSSSGSATAVGAGLCIAALGTDTSASIRLPSALCGVVGMKPTFDLLPRDGVFPLSNTLDHVGPITASVTENARVLEVLTGSNKDYSHQIGKSVAGMAIGVPNDFYGEYLSHDVRRALNSAKVALRNAGARVVSCEIRDIWSIYEAQQLVLKAEAFATHQAALNADRPYSDEVRARLLTGADLLASDYLVALARRGNSIRAFDEALSEVDVLLTPTCGTTAPRIGERSTLIDGVAHPTFWLLIRLTAPTNFTGHPSLSVPWGDANGLPIGVQLIGRHHDEALLYRMAKVLEEANRPLVLPSPV